jgi:S1-C subfamily serine protease
MRLLARAASGLLLVAALTSAARAQSLADTIERIKPSIVAIGTVEPTRNPPFQFRGTGFVIGDGTFVATNAHVLPGDVDAMKREVIGVAIPNRDGSAQVRPAVVAATDPAHDVALLKLAGPSLAALRLGDPARVRDGDSLAFTGFPIGAIIGLFPATHRALVSAITPVALTQPSARTLDPQLVRKLQAGPFRIFQLDATAYPGSSGSPMFDPRTGEVLAIVNSTLAKAGKESVLSQPSGISYAIPISYLANLLSTAGATKAPQ